MTLDLSAQTIGWDDPRTVEYYESFCQQHERYSIANEQLVAHARLPVEGRVLDVAAGTGRTSQRIWNLLQGRGGIVCVEPSAAMRRAGRARLSEQVEWVADLATVHGAFDRILCGAAIWQLLPWTATFTMIYDLLAPGGAFCFNIPSLYLGQRDRPGGGADPNLLQLAALLFAESTQAGATPIVSSDGDDPSALPDRIETERLLQRLGFLPERWEFQQKMTQAALRDWMKIPLMTNSLFPELEPEQRERRIDAAYARVDATSWRWEGWTGWTCWKPA